MKKSLLLLFFSLCFINLVSFDSLAWNEYNSTPFSIEKNLWSSWGYNGSTKGDAAATSFILAGRTFEERGEAKKNPSERGTVDDEWAIVGVIADRIVEHGGRFCMYQLQCANDMKYAGDTWIDYYRLVSPSSCTWICESGYYGENCSQTLNGPASAADDRLYTTSAGGAFSGFSLKQDKSVYRETNVSLFNAWVEKDGVRESQVGVVLGVVGFLNHGVEVAPVRVKCDIYSSKSWVKEVHIASGTSKKLLCASGYVANETNTDCVKATTANSGNFCEGFPRENYNASVHELRSSGDCVKYFCKNGTAFPAAGDYSCVECSDGVKGGPNPENGLCVSCETGQYFNGANCVESSALSKTDLMYGKGKTKATAGTDIEAQCWTKTAPDEYKRCVMGVIVTTRARNVQQISVAQ